MKFLQLKDRLKEGSYACIVLSGDDVYLKQKATQMIVDSLDISFPEMNIQVMENASLEDILFTCNTPPFASTNRLVKAKDSFLSGKVHPSTIEKYKKSLTDYAKHPSAGCCLVFDVTQNAPFFTADGIVEVDCSRLDRGSVYKWITVRFSKENIIIERDAAFLLADYCLLNMARISNEAEKLIAYGDTVTCDVIERTIQKDIEYAVFDLTNAISSKQPARALELLERMLLDKQKPKELFRMLYNGFRRMFYCAISKKTDEELSSCLKVQPYAVKKSRESARGFSAIQLKKAMDKLYEIDTKAYSVMFTPDDLRHVVMQLLNL